MSRYNIFFPIHKGLRALLFETAQTLQQTDFTDADQCAAATEEVRNAVALFEGHAHKEDNYVFTALAAYEPSVVNAFEQEHDEDHQLGQALQHWLTALSYAASDGVRQLMGQELTQAFVDYAAFNLKHMAKEERVINPLLWRYYTDAEIHAITQKIIAAIPPAENAAYTRWMVKGMNNAELSAWLQAVKNAAPQTFFEALLSLAEANLPRHRWNSVQEALTEGAMVA